MFFTSENRINFWFGDLSNWQKKFDYWNVKK